MYFYVYKTTNLINNNFYYGVHKSKSIFDTKYFGSGILLKKAIEKYGIENFQCEPVKYFDTYEIALDFEKKIITEDLIYNENCYNLNIGGKGGSTPGHIKDFSKHKLSKSLECKEKISKSLKGKCYISDEEKIKLAKRMIGNSYRLGKKDSEETRKNKKESFKNSEKHAKHLKNVSNITKNKRSELMKKRQSDGFNPMKNSNSRKKVSESKIGLKKLTLNGISKMAKPGTDKWNELILLGFK